MGMKKRTLKKLSSSINGSLIILINIIHDLTDGWQISGCKTRSTRMKKTEARMMTKPWLTTMRCKEPGYWDRLTSQTQIH